MVVSNFITTALVVEMVRLILRRSETTWSVVLNRELSWYSLHNHLVKSVNRFDYIWLRRRHSIARNLGSSSTVPPSIHPSTPTDRLIKNIFCPTAGNQKFNVACLCVASTYSHQPTNHQIHHHLHHRLATQIVKERISCLCRAIHDPGMKKSIF